jgi:2'-hydroxyisoflavone reductase
MAERRTPGVFNVTGPPAAFGDVLEDCKSAAGSEARFVWAADEWLASEGVDPWIELPLWIPEEDGRRPDMVVDCSRAISAGWRRGLWSRRPQTPSRGIEPEDPGRGVRE